jgi:hypothetical protein
MKNATGCLLSGKTSVELDYLHFAVNNVNEQSKEKSKSQSTLKSNTHSTSLENDSEIPTRLRPLIQEYDEIFHGVGKLTVVN